jgi:adenylylsulfate kinase-like enzyme
MLSFKPPIIWLFGKVCAGKTTIAKEFVRQLSEEAGYQPLLVDGDEFRRFVHPSLGFTKADREKNIRRAATYAKSLTDQHGKLPVCAFVTPMKSTRDIVKEVAGDTPVYFVHVICDDKKLLLDRRASRNKGRGYSEADKHFRLDTEELSPYYQVDSSRDVYIGDAVRELRKYFASLGPSYLLAPN